MSKKATFVLDEHMVLEVKEVVGEGLFKSMNAFVEAAIRDELAKIKKERIRKAFMEASKDRLFLSDIEAIERDFEFADSDEGAK